MVLVFQNALQQLTGQQIDPAMIAQLATLQRLLLRSANENVTSKQEGVHFDKKLLDFDYGSDEEDDHTSPKTGAASSGLDSVGRYRNKLCLTLIVRTVNSLDVPAGWI